MEEHQRVYDHKLQALIALVPAIKQPPSPPPASSKTSRGNSSDTDGGLIYASTLRSHVMGLLHHLRDMDNTRADTITSINHHRPPEPPHHPPHHQALLPSLARQVPGRVSASEVWAQLPHPPLPVNIRNTKHPISELLSSVQVPHPNPNPN